MEHKEDRENREGREDRHKVDAERLIIATGRLIQLMDAEQLDERLSEHRLAWLRVTDPKAGPEALSKLDVGARQEDWGAEDQPLGRAVICALLLMLPRGESAPKNAWDYIDKTAGSLAFDADDLHRIWGWLKGSADRDVAGEVSGWMESLASEGPLSAAVAGVAKAEREARAEQSEGEEGKDAAAAYLARRDALKGHVEALGPKLDALNIDGSKRKALLRYLDGDLFRLAVLGEFKRGKSTLINALVGKPDLMPTDLLPCTSALTELRFGQKTQYEVNERELFGSFEVSDEAHFKRTAANASVERSGRDSAEEAAESVPYWRVHVGSNFLETSRIALIDTPGLGEDHARDFIARTEAERADAAILVFDLEQTASLEELELIERMKSKASDLIVVINKADRGDEDEQKRSIEHAHERIGDRTDAISKDRIISLSAFEAEEDLRHGRSGPWLEKLDAFRSRLLEHLLERSGKAREDTLKRKAQDFVDDARGVIAHEVGRKRKLLSDLEALQRTCDRTDRAFKLAELSVKTGTQILQTPAGTDDRLVESFSTSLSNILEVANKHEETWTSKYSVITSPQKHAKEVAAKAQRSVLFAVEDWMKTDGAKIVTEGLDQQYQEARSKLDAYSAYLQDATGRDAKAHLDDVQKEALLAAFPGRIGVVETGEVVLSTVVGGALAAIVGYIVADIILFYVLKVIVGFLNPLLLASAAIVGIATYAFKGDEWVRAWIRKKIFDKISHELATDAAKDQMRQAFVRAVRELFSRVAHSFKVSASEVLAEVRHQQTSAEEALKNKQAELGTPQALKAELDRIEDHAARARAGLDALQRTLVGKPGVVGKADGANGANEPDGPDGANGANGANGSDEANGTDGADSA